MAMNAVTKTAWTEIIKHCHSLYGFQPSYMQVRFWWFGCTRGRNTTAYPRRIWAEREIASWDVVIRLALTYTATQSQFPQPYAASDITRFVFWLLWKSDQCRVQEAKDKHGKVFMAQTFWGWAVENKNKYGFQTVVSRKGTKSMQQAMGRMFEEFLKRQ